MLRVPRNRGVDPVREVRLRNPIQFVAHAPRIDGITPIVPRAIGDELNELQHLIFARPGVTRERAEYRLDHVQVSPFVVAADIVGASGHPLFEDSEQSAHVIIAVAGMEGALPSVVAGLINKPVIAVPTSVGYGASFGGIAALLAMLNSCGSGVTVVNIDNGFGAAYAATQINALAAGELK